MTTRLLNITRDGDSTVSPGSLVAMFGNPFGEEVFSNTQYKPLLAQLKAVSSLPITCYLAEETNIILVTTSLQAIVESDVVPPDTPFLHFQHHPFPQLLLTGLVL